MADKKTPEFEVRDMLPEDQSVVVALASSLKEFFPHDVVGLISNSLKKQPALVGVLGDEIVAFLAYALRDKKTAEITSFGVKEEYHGLGLGSVMLYELEQEIVKRGVRKLIASTLSYTVPYKPFEKVRTFYYHRGFTSVGIQTNYYDDGLDRLLLVKELG